MNQYLKQSLASLLYTMLQDDQQKYLPRRLLQCDDHVSNHSNHSHQYHRKIETFSAPPMLFDIGSRFYQDFIEQITQDDPELNKFGLRETFNKKNQIQIPMQGYRKFSLQNQQYSGYYAVSIPTRHPFLNNSSTGQQILSCLQQAGKWARDQYGSRAVQSIMQNGQSYAKNAAFQSLIEQAIQLTKDKFGNYVFQKILQSGEQNHKLQLFNIIKQRILQFSQNCYGCRVVQKAIQFTKQRKEYQKELIEQIEPYSLYLIQSINGNHVMQKVFQIVDLDYLSQIIQVVVNNYRKLSLHAYGCRIIQKYLEKLQTKIKNVQQTFIKQKDNQIKMIIGQKLSDIKDKEAIIFNKLVAISIELSQCQYVANSKHYKQQIQQILLQNLMILSNNKYGSNVIQKMIKISSQQYRQRLAKVLFQSQGLVNLAKHQYGNYVIQSLASKISKQSMRNIRNRLKQNAEQVSKNQYGRHVLNQLQKNK